MQQTRKARLTLVGAGPGDPDLFTIKGARALAEADVVLYDALVNKKLLTYASQNAIKIFVGKRKGYMAHTQDEINQLIVNKAFEHGHVVRLKGGDPFIFGRGTEEIEHAESFGISSEVVPGISSSAAVPANQGIALTKRGVTESFWVITGTTSQRKLSNDVVHAAKSSATVVILMGMSKLTEIVDIFKAQDKHDMPVAIIQNGTTTQEKTGIGTVETIVQVVKQKKLSSPAVIVIGEVVKHSHKLRDFYKEELVHVINS
ncbi:uroporphyrinogen-III C-methyltransferase [Ascidiimonas sp. W6]|uniref:uroporphyrinogen-III C-methyltransferase n=1 Tax=Ascidiimonas meishanensis TaxID=3128903 RepID=UPI0030EBCFCA